MTHPEHDEGREALRKQLAVTKTFNYDVYCGQDIANNCIPFEEALDEIADFILAHTTKAVEAALNKVEQEVIGEDVGQEWTLDPPPPAKVVDGQGNVVDELHHAVHQPSAREGVNKEKRRMRAALAEIKAELAPAPKESET